VIAVHHDLSTVADYFDHVFLINVRPSPKARWPRPSPPRRCRRATYGGRLAGDAYRQLALAGTRLDAPSRRADFLQAGLQRRAGRHRRGAAGLRGGGAGTFLFLRKRALVSDAMAHATLPGVGLAFIAMVALGGDGRNLVGLLAARRSRRAGSCCDRVDRRGARGWPRMRPSARCWACSSASASCC
jgi:hypothetical protein